MRFACLLICGLLATMAGCGSGPATAEVTGQVKKASGPPLDNLTVVFYPSEGPSVIAKTDASGAFKATVPVGPAKIAVVDGSEASSQDSSPNAVAPKKAQRIKPKYAVPESSGLTTNIGEKQEPLVLTVD